MPVGSGEFVSHILAESAVPGVSFTVVSNPEFLREGAAVHDIFHPDRIVLGAEDRSAAEAVAALSAPLGGRTLFPDRRAGGGGKVAGNPFLGRKISFFTGVGAVCGGLGGG